MEGEVGKMRLLDECARVRREEVVLYCAAIYHCRLKPKAGSVAEPPEITHLRRRLSSTDTKHSESELHQTGFVEHTPRKSPNHPHFSPRIQ